MRRPGFTVVTGVLVALTVVAVFRRVVEPVLPPPPRNRLAFEAADYLRQGSRQPVDWRTLSPEAFEEARQSRRPILLLVGATWSRIARQADRDAFLDRELSAFLRRNFVCVRVDADERPEMLAAYLPLSRLRREFVPGFVLWILDPGGRMILPVFPPDGSRSAIMGSLNSVLREIRRGSAPAAGELGDRELALIRAEASRGSLPPFTAFLQALERPRAPQPDEPRSPRPQAVRLALLAGRFNEANLALDRLIFSHYLDLLEGGFFRVVRGGQIVEFDKLATANGEMAHTLALAGAVTGDPVYADFGRGTFDFVAQRMAPAALLAAARLGDEGPAERSERVSFPPRRLGTLLSAEDQAWARPALALDLGVNPQMAPFPTSRDVLTAEPLARVLATLRGELSPVYRLGSLGRSHVQGHTAARLMEAARVWNDEARITRATTLTQSMESMREGIDVSAGTVVREGRYLGAYLAYADSMLQDYLANGRTTSFSRGLRVLRRAREIFAGDVPGEFVTFRGFAPPGAVHPQVADDVRESLSAAMIRLCTDYGRLLGNEAVGRSLRQTAQESTALFARLVEGSGPSAAGIYCAAASLRDDGFAVCVGPRARQLARRLFPLVPTRLVAPALGPVRTDLQGRAPGIYIVQGGQTAGPFTVEEAVAGLPAMLSLD